ncbi:MAG: ParB N-terminal domain-containing protein [Nostocaceae cyanobacterium]|nr:ParB N-terminal domain-containing protein [Nostocaceae cyanobacterium]
MPKVSIEQIHIGANRRPIKDEKVVELMESIQNNGLLNPITIDKQHNLIAGLHRLTACKLLGLEVIECNIVNYQNSQQARLAEIDENLIRNELEPLERAELWLERDELLTKMGQRAKAGDNQYTRQGGEMLSPPTKTTLDLAKEVGYSERTLQHGKQIAKSIVPEVKEMIKGTVIAKSTTELLKIARTGKKELALAESAQKALELAQAKGEQQEVERQSQILEAAKTRQKELQMLAVKNAIAQKEARLASKHTQPPLKIANNVPQFPKMEQGKEWMLERHLVYCGDTAGKDFINLLPSNAALAIATLSPTWNHDYLVSQARVVAVMRTQGGIYQFCRQTAMPFRYELVIGDIYVGIFSYEEISKPQTPVNINGVEGIVTYLLHLYTNPNNFVIAPFMGYGEIIVACERMGRTCFIGDDNPEVVSRGIIRWQKLTGGQPQTAAAITKVPS